MADVLKCREVLPHPAHNWTHHLEQINGIPEDTLQYHFCPGLKTKELDPVLRLEQYKLKLEAGQQLTEEEQQDLEEIARHVAAVVESFINALQEAFKPIIESITAALRNLWDSLPESMKVELLKEAEPRLEFKLGDVATPYSEAQSRIFGSPYTQPQMYRHRPGDLS